jgi:hypothetical protein
LDIAAHRLGHVLLAHPAPLLAVIAKSTMCDVVMLGCPHE